MAVTLGGNRSGESQPRGEQSALRDQQPMTLDFTRLRAALKQARHELLAERHAAGFWEGQLACSALSTATAISALAVVRQRLSCGPGAVDAQDRTFTQRICGGLEWLADRQNADGGWGDTDRSRSNIATTMLVMAAFQLTGVPADHQDLMARGQQYVDHQGGIRGLRRRYGRDRTFAVPILTNCALAGLIPWGQVNALPFELACFPQAWYRFLRLPVVSYAIPALVAVGQARFFHRPPRDPVTRRVRRMAVARSLDVVHRMQPHSGGFLEAVPLTSFVVMSLASIGRVDHPVVRRGVAFLLDSVRPDGSWPIDSNLAAWNTTLAVQALCQDRATEPDQVASLDWILECQHQGVHPFTGAEPGGWGWTDRSGAVPDADDTSGALLCLRLWRDLPGLAPEKARRIDSAARQGLWWLLRLQNRDGGWPTFCRGWGRLPFDRSGTDLTAHALRALVAWQDVLDGALLRPAVNRGRRFLEDQQRADGSWVPLWFGNESEAGESNPVYGTARVLLAYRDLGQLTAPAAGRAAAWLVERQLPDGSWGPPRRNGQLRGELGGSIAGSVGGSIAGSVEETAVAVEALVGWREEKAARRSLERGLEWLTQAIEAGGHRSPSPIGFYFAKLWYYERLYPLTFAASALARALEALAPTSADRPQPAPLSR